MKLKGMVAFCTAAAGAGIGQSTARMFAREGAKVVITDMHLERCLTVADQIKKDFGGDVLALQCDVTKLQDIEEAITKTIKQFGKIDILFNNAGTNRPSQIVDITDDVWELVINTSLRELSIAAGDTSHHDEARLRTHSQHHISSSLQRPESRPCTLCSRKSRHHSLYPLPRHGSRTLSYYSKYDCTKFHL